MLTVREDGIEMVKLDRYLIQAATLMKPELYS